MTDKENEKFPPTEFGVSSDWLENMSSTSITFECPLFAAKCKGVFPPCSLSYSANHIQYPPNTVSHQGSVFQRTSSKASTWAEPNCKSINTAVSCPKWAAKCNGVSCLCKAFMSTFFADGHFASTLWLLVPNSPHSLVHCTREWAFSTGQFVPKLINEIKSSRTAYSAHKYR